MSQNIAGLVYFDVIQPNDLIFSAPSHAEQRALHLSGVTKRIFYRGRLWQGEFVIDNRRWAVPLKLRIEGTPGVTIKDEGDVRFEISRKKAAEKLDLIIAYYLEELKQARQPNWRHFGLPAAEELLETLLVEDLPAEWERLASAELPPVPKRPKRKIKGAKNPRYIGQITKKLALLAALIKRQFPDVLLASRIKSKHIQKFMDDQYEKKIGTANTYNKVLTGLHGAFNKMIRLGRLQGEQNPCAGIPLIYDELSIKRSCFLETEVENILAEAERSNRLVFILMQVMLCTAMREVSACPLKWSSVNLDAGTIDVPAAKGGNPVKLPIFRPLLPILKEAAEARLKETDATRRQFVFPDLLAVYELRHDLLIGGFYDVAVRAGLKRDRLVETKEGRKRAASVLGLYSVRTTFISHALASGVAKDTIRLVTGHKTNDMIDEFYNRQRAEMIGDQFTVMPRFAVGRSIKPAPRCAAPLAAASISMVSIKEQMRSTLEVLAATEISLVQPTLLHSLESAVGPDEIRRKLSSYIKALSPATLEVWRPIIVGLIEQLA